MASDQFTDAGLFDAAQAGARALAAMDWRRMQPQAVAYAVLAEALPYLQLVLHGHARDQQASREQAAHDVIALRNRERYPWIHGGSR